MQVPNAPSRTVLRISGHDARPFLQGLVTNDVDRLNEGAIYAALLTPQGKYLADFFLIQEGEDILLDVDASLAASLVQRLSMYKLRADVVIEVTDLHVHRGLGDAPGDGWTDPRSAVLGWRAIRSVPAPRSDVDWNRIRVEAAIPETGTELISGESYILEMGFERLGGVDFRKGCYVGQEVTARMKHKAHLRKGLAQVDVSGSAIPGTPVTSGGKTIGTLCTVSGDQALAYLRFDRVKEKLAAGTASLEIIGH